MSHKQNYNTLLARMKRAINSPSFTTEKESKMQSQEIIILQHILAELQSISASITDALSVKKVKIPRAAKISQAQQLVYDTMVKLHEEDIAPTRRIIAERSGMDIIQTSNTVQSMLRNGLINYTGISTCTITGRRVQSFTINAIELK